MKIKQDKVIKVGVIYNAFDPSDMQRADMVYRKNTMLKTYLADLPKDCDWLIGLNGKPIDLAKDGKIKLQPDDNLQLVVVPHGGDGVKSILRTVALVAVAVGAALLFAPGGALAFSVLGSSAAGAALGMTAFTLAGSLLINAVLPVKAPKTDKEDSQSYGYDGAKNTAKQGVSIPVVYGLYRVAGNYVDLYTQNVGDDQYLYGRTVLSDGTIKNVTKPLLNDQPIDNYTDVDWGFTRGLPTEVVNPWFNRNTTQIQKSIKLTSSWVTHTTSSEVDQLQLNLAFTRGLVKFDDKGKKQRNTATVEVEYSEAGKNNWRPLGSSTMQTVAGDIGSGSTPNTTKLKVQVKPTLNTSGAYGAKYIYTVKYRRVGESAWTVFKTVNDIARGVNYEIKDFSQDEINNASAVYSPADEDHTYEWAVPQGQYQIAVEGGSIASYGYVLNSPSSSTYSWSDNRAKSLRKTIESGKLDYGLYDVRIRKSSAEGDNEKSVDELYITDVGEITNSGITLRHIANAYYRIKMNEQLNGVPNITWLVEGVEVNHYDRNGNVTQKAWSDNPAWIVLDMLIGPERGTPGIYQIDYPMFVEWAEWCEAQGLKFNGIFDSSQSLWDTCVDVLKIGHASFSRIGTKLSLTIDKPQDPVMLFGPGNIFKDTFKVSYLPMTGRANEFELSYFDKNDNNAQKTIRIVDPEADQRGDISRPVTFSMPGIDNYTQAQKEAWYQLYNNRYLRRTITFDAPIESIGLGIGEVALIQHDMMDWGTAGRLASGSTTTTLKLDKLMELEAGKDYSALVIHDVMELARTSSANVASVGGNYVRVNNMNNIIANSNTVKRLVVEGGPDYEVMICSLSGANADILLDRPYTPTGSGDIVLYNTDVIEERDITWNPDNGNVLDTINVSTPFSKAPSLYSNYMAGEKTIVKKPYRLKSINGSGFDKRTLTFTEYNPSIYNPPEYIVPLPPTTLPKGVKHVSGLQYVYDLRSTEANTVVTGVLSWNASDISNYGGVDIYVARNGADFVFSKTILNASETQLDFNFGDDIRIKVVAFNTTSVRAPIGTAPVIAQTIVSGGAYLDAPTDVTIKQISYLALGIAELTWSTPTTALTIPVKFRVQLKLADGQWDEYAVTSENILRVGDLAAGNIAIRVRTERAEAFSTWVEKTFSITTTSQTIQPGATVGGTVGENIKNPDGSVWVPPTTGGPVDSVPPGIPTNLAVTSTLTDAGVDVVATWTAPNDDDMAGYDISIKENNGSFIDFMSSSPTYKWQALKRNTVYTVKVRAYDKAGNRSGWTNEVAITSAKDNVPPASVTNVTVETAYNTAFVTWTNPSDGDLERVELRLVDSNGNVIKIQSVSSAPNTIGKATWSNLNKSTTYSCYLLAYDTSGNEAIVTNSGNFTTAGGIDLNDFTPGQQPISTVATLPTPNGYNGPTLVYNQADGKLYRYKNGNWAKEVDGSDVIQGSIAGEKLVNNTIDNTKIADNSINNQKLVDGSVNSNKISDGAVGNTKIAQNAITTEKLVDGAIQLNKFADGLNPVERVTSLPGAGKVGRVVLLTSDSKIYRDTGSSWTKAVDGGDVVANSITAQAIAAGTITGDKIAANSINARNLAIGNFDNIIPDGDMRDLSFWNGNTYNTDGGFGSGVAQVGVYDQNQQWRFGRMMRIGNPIDTYWYTPFFPVEIGATYKLDFQIYFSPDFNGWLNISLHHPGVSWRSIKTGFSGYDPNVNYTDAGSHTFHAGDTSFGPNIRTFTIPSDVNNYTRRTQFRFDGHWTQGYVEFMVNMVRVSDATLIRDGAIETNKIAANAITADKIAANTIAANKLVVASRPVSMSDLNLRYENGVLKWNAGNVVTVDNDGNTAVYYINGGSVSGAGYLVYSPGSDHLEYVNDPNLVSNSSWLKIAYYDGGLILNVIAGVSTVINGANIVTGTINADKIQVRTIGADRIAAGAITSNEIAANSITANQLVLASRPISTFGLNIRIETNGGVYWDAGQIRVVNNDGSTSVYDVSAGSVGLNDFMMVYVPGRTYIDYVVDRNTFLPNSAHIKIADRVNGDLKVYAGVSTILNGERIVTGSINANKIIARTITADQIAANAITANELAANSITAGKLTIQTKPISTSGCNIRVETNGAVYWDAGTITFPDSNGNYITRTVTAGSTQWYGWDRPVNLCYNSNLDNTGFGWIYYSIDLPSHPEMIPVAIWNNGSDLSIKSGVSTRISGDRIVTGSLNANKIQGKTIGADQIATGALTADLIQAGTITAAQIASGAITARVLAIGNPDNVIGDSGFRDALWWNGGNPDSRLSVGDSGMVETGRELKITGTGEMDFYSLMFPVEPGASYKINVGVYTYGDFSGNFRPMIHMPSYAWFSLKSAGGIDPEDTNPAFNYNAASTYYKNEFSFDNPNNTNQRQMQFRLRGNWSGTVAFVCKIVRISDTTLIRDGSITTDKIIVNSLNGDRIQAGSLNADKITAGSVLSNFIKVSGSPLDNLGDIANRASNPAERVNQMSTQISPGLINISGGTTLANWKQGGDETKIAGGAISANTIDANKLTIGNRGIGFLGLNFQWNPNNNYINWSEGYITYVGDNGGTTSQYITAGDSGGAAAHRIFYWIKGEGSLRMTQSLEEAVGNDRIQIASWWGGWNINVNYGGTIIHGDRITTGTINADRIAANTILANNLVIGGTNTTLGTVNAVVSDPAYYINQNQTTINGGKITTGTLDAGAIRAGTVLSNYVQIGGTGLGSSFDIGAIALAAYDPANRINNGTSTTISGGKITTGSIEANKLNVGSLSAITANIGLLRTATSGQRTEIDNNGMRTYNGNGNLVFQCGIY